MMKQKETKTALTSSSSSSSSSSAASSTANTAISTTSTAEQQHRGNVDISSISMGAFPCSSSLRFMSNIGRGAYGVVNKAFDLRSCRIVAVKRSRSPKKSMMDSLKKEVLICREFAACAEIVNLVSMDSFGRDRRKNELCIALEYMDCGSLRNKQSFTIREVQWITMSVLKALRALHGRLMVHNDVKPDNILFDSFGAVKLTDFGCVKQMEDAWTPLTEPVGSLRFQSYEKKFLSPIRYTTKSDLYSVGVTVAEILNGSHIEDEHHRPSQQHPQSLRDGHDAFAVSTARGGGRGRERAVSTE